MSFLTFNVSFTNTYLALEKVVLFFEMCKFMFKEKGLLFLLAYNLTFTRGL